MPGDLALNDLVRMRRLLVKLLAGQRLAVQQYGEMSEHTVGYLDGRRSAWNDLVEWIDRELEEENRERG